MDGGIELGWESWLDFLHIVKEFNQFGRWIMIRSYNALSTRFHGDEINSEA